MEILQPSNLIDSATLLEVVNNLTGYWGKDDMRDGLTIVGLGRTLFLQFNNPGKTNFTLPLQIEPSILHYKKTDNTYGQTIISGKTITIPPDIEIGQCTVILKEN